jgi:hypothetical protein
MRNSVVHSQVVFSTNIVVFGETFLQRVMCYGLLTGLRHQVPDQSLDFRRTSKAARLTLDSTRFFILAEQYGELGAMAGPAALCPSRRLLEEHPKSVALTLCIATALF